MRPDHASLDEFGQRLRPYLDAGCDGLPPQVVQRLAEARRQAVLRNQSVPMRELAWAGPPRSARGRFNEWPWRRGAAGLLVLTALLVGVQWWQGQQAQQERQDEVEQDVATLMGTPTNDPLPESGSIRGR